MALLEGALKYGRSNWRVAGVRASIYVDALRRHMTRWFEGEDVAPDSGIPHLAHALACLAILVDAQAAGKLNDDRMVPGGTFDVMEDMTPHVKRLQEKYADMSPRHYTIADDPDAPPRSNDIDNFLSLQYDGWLRERKCIVCGQPEFPHRSASHGFV
jgi:hypothetical protein